jgi:hypothetical protein
MDQFGGSTRGGRGEIPAVYEDRVQPAQLRVQRTASAGGPAADDADVERLSAMFSSASGRAFIASLYQFSFDCG